MRCVSRHPKPRHNSKLIVCLINIIYVVVHVKIDQRQPHELTILHLQSVGSKLEIELVSLATPTGGVNEEIPAVNDVTHCIQY